MAVLAVLQLLRADVAAGLATTMDIAQREAVRRLSRLVADCRARVLDRVRRPRARRPVASDLTGSAGHGPAERRGTCCTLLQRSPATAFTVVARAACWTRFAPRRAASRPPAGGCSRACRAARPSPAPSCGRGPSWRAGGASASNWHARSDRRSWRSICRGLLGHATSAAHFPGIAQRLADPQKSGAAHWRPLLFGGGGWLSGTKRAR